MMDIYHFRVKNCYPPLVLVLNLNTEHLRSESGDPRMTFFHLKITVTSVTVNILDRGFGTHGVHILGKLSAKK